MSHSWSNHPLAGGGSQNDVTFEFRAHFAIDELIDLIKEDPQRLDGVLFANAKHSQKLIDFLEAFHYT